MPLANIKYQEQVCFSYSPWIVLPDSLQESSLMVRLSACAGVRLRLVEHLQD